MRSNRWLNSLPSAFPRFIELSLIEPIALLLPVLCLAEVLEEVGEQRLPIIEKAWLVPCVERFASLAPLSLMSSGSSMVDESTCSIVTEEESSSFTAYPAPALLNRGETGW